MYFGVDSRPAGLTLREFKRLALKVGASSPTNGLALVSGSIGWRALGDGGPARLAVIALASRLLSSYSPSQ